MSINQVTISGNLTREPDLRATQSGSAILRLGVAVNDRVKNPQTNQYEDRPNFIDCIVFGKRAESLSNLLHKGMKVAVQGKLRYSSWQDQQGQNRSKLEVIVDELEFMQARNQQAAYQPNQAPVATPPAVDDDCPF